MSTIGSSPKNKIKIETNNGETFLVITDSSLKRVCIRRKDIQSLSPYMSDIYSHDDFCDGTLIGVGFGEYIHAIHDRAELVNAINAACDQEELKEELNDLRKENAELRKELDLLKKGIN